LLVIYQFVILALFGLLVINSGQIFSAKLINVKKKRILNQFFTYYAFKFGKQMHEITGNYWLI